MDWVNKYSFWASIPGALIGLVIALSDPSKGPLIWRVFVGFVGGGLAAAILITMLFAPIALGVEMAKQEANYFKKAAVFFFGIFGVLWFFDITLVGGVFISAPLVALMLGGWEDTFWGCTGDWIWPSCEK